MNQVIDNTIVSRIQDEIDNDRLILPSMPDVAIRVREAVNQGNITVPKLAEMILTDAALSARLIQVANSPLYRGRVEIENLPNAISRLGMNTTRTLITNLVMKQMFQSKSASLTAMFQVVWEHSVSVSAISRALASRCHYLNPDQAMLSGLIHQIGKLPILMYAEKHIDQFQDQKELGYALEKHHITIGSLIMNAWKFSDSFCQVVSEYQNFMRQSCSQPEYVDVVQIAYIEACGGIDKLQGTIGDETIPAFAKLGLAPEIEVFEIEGITAEIEEAQNLMIV